MKKSLTMAILSSILITFLCLPHVLAGEKEKDSTLSAKGYVPYEDSSDCPVKILAYRIDYMESGETTVSLLLKNTSDLQAVGFQGTLQLLDSDGKNVDSVQGDPIFIFKDHNPLPANSQPCQGSSFIVEEGRRLKNVKPQITQVLFEDQSIWRGI